MPNPRPDVYQTPAAEIGAVVKVLFLVATGSGSASLRLSTWAGVCPWLKRQATESRLGRYHASNEGFEGCEGWVDAAAADRQSAGTDGL